MKNQEPETIEIKYNITFEVGDSNKIIPVQILKVPFIFGQDEQKNKVLIKNILLKICD